MQINDAINEVCSYKILLLSMYNLYFSYLYFLFSFDSKQN